MSKRTNLVSQRTGTSGRYTVTTTTDETIIVDSLERP